MCNAEPPDLFPLLMRNLILMYKIMNNHFNSDFFNSIAITF